MIGLGSSALKSYLAVEPCDMLMGFNGQATAATEQLAQPLGQVSHPLLLRRRAIPSRFERRPRGPLCTKIAGCSDHEPMPAQAA